MAKEQEFVPNLLFLPHPHLLEEKVLTKAIIIYSAVLYREMKKSVRFLLN